MKNSLVSMFVIFAAAAACAADTTYSWKNGNSGSWTDADNWINLTDGVAGFPAEGDVALFDAGTTGRVELAQATTIDRLDVSATGASVTLLMPTDSVFSATGELIVGESTVLVIDAQGGATFSKPSKTRLSAGARLSLLNGVKYSTDGTYTKGDGASLRMTGGSSFISGDHIWLNHKDVTLELDDSNMFSWNTIRLGDGFRLIARGERAQLSPRSGFFSSGTLTVDVELPENDFSTRYNFAGSWRTAQGLIAYGADGMDFPSGAQVTFNVLRSSPGRLAKGTRTYTLVNCSGSSGKRLDASQVTLAGLNGGDHVVYTWEDGADPETDAAYRLQVSVSGGSGFRLSIR